MRRNYDAHLINCICNTNINFISVVCSYVEIKDRRSIQPVDFYYQSANGPLGGIYEHCVFSKQIDQYKNKNKGQRT